MKYMTKKQAEQEFMYKVLMHIGSSDKPRCREAWNNYTDALCKAGEISTRQYNTWTHPNYEKLAQNLFEDL